MTAIQAEFVNYKNVPTRKTMQLIFELPQELAVEVLNTLGVPKTEESIWCGIARLGGHQEEQGRGAAE